jgi:hypothetical protein
MGPVDKSEARMTAEWITGRYGSETMTLGRVGEIMVFWDATRPKDAPERLPPYTVTIFGHQMKRRFDDASEAKAYALRVAQTWLAHAWAELPDKQPAPEKPA